MEVQMQIEIYLSSLPEPKRSEMERLHHIILELMPTSKLWFLDGKNSDDKVVSNPNIGYGLHHIQYVDGTSKEFYQIGLSSNTTGISIYILGIDDKMHLSKMYKEKIGKATVTGYCIKFKKLQEIDQEVLKEAICDGVEISRKG